MRAGYLMHRFAHGSSAPEMPPVSYTTDGAELGKVMVAEGLGLTVLPDYSVAGDPLERAGLITAPPHRRRPDRDHAGAAQPARRAGAARGPRPARGAWSPTPAPTAGEPDRAAAPSQRT